MYRAANIEIPQGAWDALLQEWLYEESLPQLGTLESLVLVDGKEYLHDALLETATALFLESRIFSVTPRGRATSWCLTSISCWTCLDSTGIHGRVIEAVACTPLMIFFDPSTLRCLIRIDFIEQKLNAAASNLWEIRGLQKSTRGNGGNRWW